MIPGSNCNIYSTEDHVFCICDPCAITELPLNQCKAVCCIHNILWQAFKQPHCWEGTWICWSRPCSLRAFFNVLPSFLTRRESELFLVHLLHLTLDFGQIILIHGLSKAALCSWRQQTPSPNTTRETQMSRGMVLSTPKITGQNLSDIRKTTKLLS